MFLGPVWGKCKRLNYKYKSILFNKIKKFYYLKKILINLFFFVKSNYFKYIFQINKKKKSLNILYRNKIKIWIDPS